MTGVLTIANHERNGPDLGNPLRAILAWFAACLGAGLVLALIVFLASIVEQGWRAFQNPSEVLAVFPAAVFVSVFIAMFTALPWLILVLGAKFFRLHRGFADIVLGALMGGGLFGFVFGGFQVGAFGVTLAFGFAGALGGLVYWIVTGKPR